MKSIFIDTFNLKVNSSVEPLEDFMSEIFAFCIQSFPQLLYTILDHLKVEHELDGYLKVRTQFKLKKLKNHSQDSRPDIVVWSPDYAIIIECKVNSEENPGQLDRYAEQLDKKFGGGLLLYLTKEQEVKDLDYLHHNRSSRVIFKQLRWFDVYQLGSRMKKELLITEMLKFMEHNKIALSNRFRLVDIVALSNFSHVKELMNETISGEISERFKQIAGGISTGSVPMTQLNRHDRYIHMQYQKNHIWIGFGYYLNTYNDSKDYPEIRFVVEVSPKSPEYARIKEVMSRISEEHEDWNGYRLDTPNTWAGIYLSKSLSVFMNEIDHVESIKSEFLNLFDKYENVKNEFESLI